MIARVMTVGLLALLPVSCGESSTASTPRPTATAAPAAEGARSLDAEGTPLWAGAVFPADSAQNTCSGTVLRSEHGDLVLTAAHCISGTGVGMRFVPGLAGGNRPMGTWTVTAVYVDDAWQENHAALDDFAILRVVPTSDPSDGGSDQGGDGAGTLPPGLPLGEDPAPGTSVTVTGYAGGEDQALTCTAATIMRRTEVGEVAAFPCEGYIGGTSGSAWVSEDSGEAEIVGLIGGYHLGGCRSHVSYTSPVSRLAPLLAQVEAGKTPSDVPPAGEDGCGD